MSASDKKKLRKEQNAAALTERQLKENKEAKKLKVYTISFVVVMLLVVAIILGMALKVPVSGMIDRNTNAITVGSHTLSTADFNYYYHDTINTYVSQFDNYGDYAAFYLQMVGLDTTKPLNAQKNSSGVTWDTYFVQEAMNSAKRDYALYDAAKAANFTLSEDARKSMDNMEATLELYAQYSNFSSVNAFLRARYGDGANLKTYLKYFEVSTTASEFATQYHDSLKFVDANFREHEKDKYNEYSSYSYYLHKITSSDYLTFLGLGEEVKGDDGKTTTTYSDADKAKALEAAKKDAQALVAEGIIDLETLNAAINNLEINKPKTDDKETSDTEADDKTDASDVKDKTPLIKATEAENVLYSKVLSNTNEDVQKWLSDSARKAGDVTFVEISTGTGDDKTVTGYYVVMFQSVNENKYKLADVQHILVKFTGGTKGSDGKTVYSQAEKDAAKAKAQAILDEFLKGEKKDTEAFSALAKSKSEDTGSKDSGGLIAGIHNDAGYVEAFTEWALQEHKVGDTGLVETEYGWHVMFFKGNGELTYRDYMINNDLISETYTAWEDGLVKAITATEVNLKGIKRDLVIGAASGK